MKHLLSLALILLLSSCSSAPDSKAPLRLAPASFGDLPGWTDDDFKGFAEAFDKSCARLQKTSAVRPLKHIPQAGTAGDWQKLCAAFTALPENAAAQRSFFEGNFQPYSASAAGNAKGLFTGYYEASLNGSRTQSTRYRYPLYKRPDDLVMVNLGEFRESMKGERIAGRVINGQLKLYENREQITTGQWPHNDQVLLWVDNAVDAFFLQIQGSGVVRLDDGSITRIGYAGQNGHFYYAIGRELIKRGVLTKEEVSMQSIRAWLEANPSEAEQVMNTNPSYVFFKENPHGAMGAEGVTLTAGRSLAIDRGKIPYGLPVWVDIDPPLEGEQGLQRLMMTQDTGGAIRGAVRGDVYWGYGKRAEYMAGHMKSQGRYWLLLPKQ